MNTGKLSLAILLTGAVLTAAGLEFRQQGEVLIFRTARTEVKVKNARITAVKNLTNGVELAGEKTPAGSSTAGIGNMTGQPEVMSKLHFPWGEPMLNQSPVIGKTITLYRYPNAKSNLKVERTGKTVKAVWTGLTDSRRFYPKDFIELRFFEDENGALSFHGTGFTEMKGVFGLQIPIENLDGTGKFFLPNFGGLEYPASGKPALFTYNPTSLFYEAKLMTFEVKNTALGYWSEDPDFRPYFIMVGRGAAASSFGLEINNIMPFEPHNTVKTPVVKIDTFADSGWIAAARPYRNWYWKQFAAQIARRDSIPWANGINAVSDTGIPSDAVLKRIGELMPANRVLLQVWQARKEGFDTKLPDYTVRPHYPADVRRAHKYGFKVMCYLNALCANYRSPVWDRDHLEDFFLTRPNSITNYNGLQNAFDENVVGSLTAAKGKDRFARLKPGKLVYGDPLSKGWRQYYTRTIVEMNRQTGTDANYQDTLGCTSDNGNGFIDGLSGAQGNQQLAADLADAMPNIPMASEFGQDAVSMSVKWTLNTAQKWGKKRFRPSRIHRQVPLTAFLFGNRTWIHTVIVNDDLTRHVVTACSDALGGMGMFAATPNMDIKSGFADHLVLRSKIFTEKQLVPWFPEKKYPENIRCMYQDAQKRIYQYYDDGKLQMMLDPDGKPLYGRVDGVSSIASRGLFLPGWPASDNKGIYGLDPANRYALFPNDIPPEINLGRLPDGVTVKYYYSTPEYAYLELDGKGPFNWKFGIPARFRKMWVNDKAVEPGRIEGHLPVRVFMSTGKTFIGNQLLQIDDVRGLQYGNAIPLTRSKRFAGETLYYMGHYDSNVLDSVIEVKNNDDALELLFRNLQNKYGNGSLISVHINGSKIAEFDCYTPVKRKSKKDPAGIFDTKLRKWTIPLGKYRGSLVLASIRVSQKISPNSDFMFVSRPRLVRDQRQKLAVTFPDPANPVPKPKKYVPPSGSPEQSFRPTFNDDAVKKQTMIIREKGINIIFSKEMYPVQRDKQVFLSGRLRLGSEGKGTVSFGVVYYDARNRQITGPRISRIPDTLTTLSAEAKAGDTRLMVFDASRWQVGGLPAVGKELPAREVLSQVEGISKYGSDYGVFLKKPLKKAIESGTPIALHKPSSTFYYVFQHGKLNREFTLAGGQLQWWPGAVKYRVILLSRVPVQFEEIKLDIYGKKPQPGNQQISQ